MRERTDTATPEPSFAAEPPNAEPRRLLAIESSCDESAAAVIDERLNVLASIVASQHELHERFGGVVPEIASRAHLRCLLPVIDQALAESATELKDLAAIAVATQPGLVGSLLVGLTAAKALTLVLEKPLIAVDHIHAHIYACRMAAGRDVFPCVGLVVSGGHTNLYACGDPTDIRLLGSTVDDAAGEAFDKVAQLLGLSYPGGPAIERAAERGDPQAVAFPRPFLNDPRLCFSFSGLKTAVRYAVQGVPGQDKLVPPLTNRRVADLAASFQEAVVDVLVAKTCQAVRQTGTHRVCVGGGVAANRRFRERLTEAAQRDGFELIVAPPQLCTDNAAMGAIAWELFHRGRFADLDVDVSPGLVRG